MAKRKPQTEHKKTRKTSRKQRTPAEKKHRRKKRRIILLSIVAALVIFRFFLPSIVLRYLNNQLADLKEYSGHIEDIDIHLYRGAYVINGVKILKKTAKSGKNDTIPFFQAEKVDLSLQWSELFHGAVVGKIALMRPKLNFVKNAHKGEDLHADTSDLKRLIDKLMPMTINRFDIHQGEIHVIDPYASPRFDIIMENVEASATNISNVRNGGDSPPAKLHATAKTYAGTFTLDTKFNANSVKPTFDLNAKLEHLDLRALNPFFKAYGNFDVERGNFALYAELAAKDGKFGGYVKPIMDHLRIASWKKEEGNIAQIAYETVIGLVINIFKNQRKQQIATEIPFSGSTDDPKVGFVAAILNAFRNAFIVRYKHAFDDSVDIDHLQPEGPVKKLTHIFDGKDKHDKKNKKHKHEKKKD